MKPSSCLILGAGYMTEEYLKILNFKEIQTIVLGRGIQNVNKIKEKFKVNAFSGGTDLFNFELYNFSHAIVAVSVQNLYSATTTLIRKGIKKILVEKPACLTIEELEDLIKLCNEFNANVYIAYNRRFYNSVKVLKNKIIEEGGVELVNFEFTEWVHTIDQNKFPLEVLNKFFLANSTHVVDTVFDLIGNPSWLTNLVTGNKISWHPSGSLFIGFGISVKGIPFSYSSNWSSAGRWAIEIITKENRYYLKPMEELFVQKNGSIDILPIKIPTELDNEFKPGLNNMIDEFFSASCDNLCTLVQQKNNFSFYEKMAGYKNNT